MNKLRLMFLVLTIGLSHSINATSLVPESITLSYISHPFIEDNVVPLMQRVYGELGIQVEFVLQPSQRNMYLASTGQTDGEVAYSELLINDHDNLVKVGSSLIDSQFTLLCHDSVKCDVAVLGDREINVLITDASHGGMKHHYGNEFLANPYFISTLSSIPKLVEQERLYYGIYVTTKNDLSLEKYHHLNRQYLFSTATYHVLNDKLKHLVPLVSDKMEKYAAQFIPSYASQNP